MTLALYMKNLERKFRTNLRMIMVQVAHIPFVRVMVTMMMMVMMMTMGTIVKLMVIQISPCRKRFSFNIPFLEDYVISKAKALRDSEFPITMRNSIATLVGTINESHQMLRSI